MKRYFGLADADAFYCSAETVFRPDWRHKAIISLSNNDGVCISLNARAKSLGLKKFRPYFELKPICDKHGVIVVSSNYELLASLSERMMNIIGRFAPRQHIYSIDEMLLDFGQCSSVIKNYFDYGWLIRKTVWREARLPVCVGIGESITLAKAANHAAKRLEGYNKYGVCVIDNEAIRVDILSRMSLKDVWGCGERLANRLNLLYKIDTALQLSCIPPKMARKQFGVDMERIVLELNGIPAKNWDEGRADKQQIFSTRSLGQRITDLPSLNQALVKHVAIAAEKLRAQGSVCRTLMMFASNSSYDESPAGIKRLIQFPVPTSDTTVMASAVSKALAEIYQEGPRYYRIGVGLLELAPAKQTQLDLFNTDKGNPKLMKVLDAVNGRYGRETVFVAGQGISPKWAMRREFLTPKYTTRWSDLPRLKC